LRQVFATCAALLMIALVACLTAGAQDSGSDDSEVWGGRDISMHMTAAGASIEFDCAQGSVTEPIKPNAAGEFRAAGSYTPELGGPVRKDNPPRAQPATYKGTISGNTMHLEIILADKTQQPPSFALTKGSEGRVVKCR